MLGFDPDWKEWKTHWKGMPDFFQQDMTPYQTINIHFRCPEDRESFGKLIGRKILSPGKYPKVVWWPDDSVDRYADKRFRTEEPTNPKYPIYVPSKGRWDSCLTMRALDKIGVPYKAVVEAQERKRYARMIGADKLLILPHRDKGLVATRNWIWDHARDSGVARFWTIDDNVKAFYRLHNNLKTPVATGAIFRVMEEFAERYSNVPVLGMNYFMFASRKSVVPPFVLNTRVYSNMLIETNFKDPKGNFYRNEGFYNDDTDLCLRMLKDGFCTVLFNAFLIEKSTTMTVKGGMTPHYQGDGRLKMAQELKDKHPDVVTITRKWGRWQHQVDYSRFRRNRLKPKIPLDELPDVDNFGMYLERDEDRPLLLIGQAPSQNGDPDKPLEGKIGNRLAKLAGLSTEEYLERTERVNLLSEWPGKDGKGDEFDAETAKQSAKDMTERLKGRRVLFLGRKVAAAFGETDLSWMEWKTCRRLKAEVAAIPHPSGIVLWWNDPENKKKAAEFLRKTFAAKDPRN